MVTDVDSISSGNFVGKGGELPGNRGITKLTALNILESLTSVGFSKH